MGTEKTPAQYDRAGASDDAGNLDFLCGASWNHSKVTVINECV